MFVLLIALAIACAAAACRPTTTQPPPAPAIPADTWAIVDGREIKQDEVEKTYRRTRGTAETLSEEETLAAKLNLLNEMIVQDVLLAKAAQLKLEVTPSELDTAYADTKKNMADDAFQRELTRRSLTPEDIREGLRRELLIQKVIDREVGSKIVVPDEEVTRFFDANRAQFNMPEESYHIAQIAITPIREPQAPNATGDDATTPEAATAKAQMLLERLKSGAPFQDLAAAYSEDPDSAPRGGDLGFLPVSRLRQAPKELRDAVLNKTPGTVSVASAGGAHTIVLVIAHEQAGQRDLSTPGVRDRIVETLRERKTQLLRAAYLTTARADVKAVNYLARRLVESKGGMPAAPPATTGGT